MSAILSSLGVRAAVARAVIEREALAVKSLRADGSYALEPINFDSVLESALLHLCDLESDNEADLALDLAAAGLDDGECHSIAIAISRQWAIATDDKKARSQIKLYAPQLQVLQTPDILHHWSRATNAPAATIAICLSAVEQRASFFPARRAPHFGWWKAHTKDPITHATSRPEKIVD